MKKYLLLFFIAFTANSMHAQWPLAKGIESIGNASTRASFIFKDKNNIIWSGGSAMNYFGVRTSEGISQYVNFQWKPIFATGTFTDVIEIDSTLYFTTYEGLYRFQNKTYTLDKKILKATCVATLNNKIIIGTLGNGLFEKTDTGYKKILININGNSYDTIYCLHEKDNELWIGTTKGLLKFDNTNFSQYSLPIVNSSNSRILKDQQEVISIKKDRVGRVWVLNRNIQDSLPCIYFLEQEKFVNPNQYYSAQCLSKGLIPVRARNLELDKNGNLIIGLQSGILTLGQDSIYNYLFYKPNSSTSFNKINAGSNLIYCDKNGLIYTYTSSSGFLILNPNQYSNSEILYDGTKAIKTLDINDLKVSVSNVGIHFPVASMNNPTLNLPHFQIPSIGCATPIFSGAIWMGGKEANGDLHMSAETYRQIGIDYKPGPIDLKTKIYDSVSSQYYNKIWKIDRQTIDEFLKSRKLPFYVIPKSILEWPANGTLNYNWELAPFVDLNSNGNYEPELGEYPKIKGDQMLWWVFNDLGKHTESGGLPLGVEVHGTCYAFLNKDLPLSDTNAIINRTLLLDYKIINRSENDYKDFYVGLWTDPDLGNYADDYIGIDSLNNAVFCYNSNNFDSGEKGFGKNPPIIFCKMLNSKMNNVVYYNNNTDPINGNPNQTDKYYNYMKTKNNMGTWILSPVKGFKDSFIKKYVYNSKICDDSVLIAGSKSPADRRFLMSSYLPIFKKDSTYDIEFAYTLLHDPNIDFLKQACDLPGQVMHRLQNWYDNNTFPSKPYYGAGVKAMMNTENELLIYPNPTNGLVHLKSNLDAKEVSNIEIFDNNGKCVYLALNNEKQGAFETSIDINAYASGLYFVKIQTNAGVLFGKVIKD